jgi:hypothetical protein
MKTLVLAVTGVFATITAVTIGLLVVPVLALKSGNALAADPCEAIQAPRNGDVIKITPIPYARVQTIRRLVNPLVDGPNERT